MPLQRTDDGVLVEFYSDAVPHPFESEKQGRPIFREVEMIRIIIPGDSRTEVVRAAGDVDRQKYNRAFEDYQRSGQKAQSGTPIEEWPQLSKTEVAEIKGLKINTVEQLAQIDDPGRYNMGPNAVSLTARARAYLAAASDTSTVQRYAAQGERDKAEIERLKKELDEARSELKAVQKESDRQHDAPRRGRPPKHREEEDAA